MGLREVEALRATRGKHAARARWRSAKTRLVETLEPRHLLAGDGLTAFYYDNHNLTDPAAFSRIDPTIDFNWGAGAPAPNMDPEYFSVFWTGQIEAKYSETYTFSTLADDGTRLWVNGQLVIDNWYEQSVQESTGTITLEAGRRYNIALTYFEGIGDASVSLSWESPTQIKQIVPQAQLYSQEVGEIVGFTLFDADLDTPIGPLMPGAVIDLSQLPTKNLSIRSDFIGPDVDSVRMHFNAEPVRIENSSPYMLNGNTEENVKPWVAKSGSYTLTSIPHSQDNALGIEGIRRSISFTVINPQVPPPPPSKLTVRSTSDRDVTLSWQDNSGDECDFVVERSLDGVTWTYSGTTGHEIFTDSSLNSLTRYQFRVKAVNAAGESAYTTRVRARTDERDVAIPGYPGPHNTGPTNRSILVPSGSFTVTQNNAVIENLYVIGQITIAAHNVRIRNFVIEAGTNVGIRVNSDFLGTIIEDGEITGPLSTNGVSGSNYTARRLHIHHMGSDAFRVFRNVVIEDCYIHDLGLVEGSHGDGVQMFPTDGGNIVIEGNHIDARGANAALFQVTGGWKVGGNYFNGGNFTIQATGEVGNKFVNNSFGRAAKFGVIRVGAGDDDLIVWTRNVWADTGLDILL